MAGPGCVTGSPGCSVGAVICAVGVHVGASWEVTCSVPGEVLFPDPMAGERGGMLQAWGGGEAQAFMGQAGRSISRSIYVGKVSEDVRLSVHHGCSDALGSSFRWLVEAPLPHKERRVRLRRDGRGREPSCRGTKGQAVGGKD